MKKKLFIGLAAAIFVFGAVWSASADNLVVNGDFNAGNTGFTTSYSYANPMIWQPDHYIVRIYDTFADHTTGDGPAMFVDGAYSRNPLWTVWQEVLIVKPDTDYQFQAWARSTPTAGPVITLSFLANGSQLGTLVLPQPTADPSWQLFSCTWNSGSSTSATIRIVDLQTNNSVPGNDFVLDDISFTAPAVPVPAAVWLFGSGLLGLVGFRRKIKR